MNNPKKSLPVLAGAIFFGAVWPVAAADFVTKEGGIACTSEETTIEAHIREITTDEEYRGLGCLRMGAGIEMDVIYVKQGTGRVRIYAPDGRRLLMWMADKDFEKQPETGEGS